MEDTAALARAVAIPVLASGGVGTIADLIALAALPGIAGTIVGRALYTGAIDLPTALATLRPADSGRSPAPAGHHHAADARAPGAGSARASDPGGRFGRGA